MRVTIDWEFVARLTLFMPSDPFLIGAAVVGDARTTSPAVQMTSGVAVVV